MKRIIMNPYPHKRPDYTAKYEHSEKLLQQEFWCINLSRQWSRVRISGAVWKNI